VLSLLGRYFYNMYIVKMFELVFSLTYKYSSVLFQSEGPCLLKTVNMVVFFVKSNGNTYPKGGALMQMYRVIPIRKC